MATLRPDELPILTAELARQIESAFVQFTVQRMEGIAQQPGNPFGARIDRFGDCVALGASLPLAWMNTIHLVGETDLDALHRAAAEYREAGRQVRVEVIPTDLTPQLSAALASMGLVQQSFHAAVYGPVSASPEPLADRVAIRTVSANNFEVFLDTFLAGFQSSPAAKVNMRHWIERPNWRLYLATVDDQPAAAGVLSIHDTMGYLGAAATIPEFRGLGCQSALIEKRIADARELGCELITGQCAYASESHRNMHRAGLRLAYTKAIWTDR